MNNLKQFINTGALAFTLIAPMCAQTNSLQVNVPFAFNVGTEKMAAGTYSVQTTESGLVTLQGAGRGVTFLSTPFDLPGRASHPSLIFERRNGSASLIRVQNDSTSPSRQLRSATPAQTISLQPQR